MIYKLSPSSLSLMEECPRCFWLYHNKQIKRPDGIMSSLPNGMDYILKAYYDKFIDKNKLPPELAENKESENCTPFCEKDVLRCWRNNLTGITWKDEEGNILHGAVDNILISENNKLIVLDYKTRGFPLKEDTSKHYQNQLNIYNFLLRKNGYETEDYSFLLFYIPKEIKETGEVLFEKSLIKMKVDVREAEVLWKKALRLLKGSCPKNSECSWCKNIN